MVIFRIEIINSKLVFTAIYPFQPQTVNRYDTQTISKKYINQPTSIYFLTPPQPATNPF